MRKILLGIVVLTLLLCGCGEVESSEKLDSEPVDIESIHCEDSIQNVYKLLGQSEIFTDSEGQNLCTYEGINLWGYSGFAAFVIRGDMDTIQRFYCNLYLDSQQFSEFLQTFTDKYGDYEKHGFSNSTTYSWRFNETEEGYYEEIKISDDGKKAIKVAFNNHWSFYDDEYYVKRFEPIENNDEAYKVLASKSYYLNDDEIIISIVNEDGNKKFLIEARLVDEINLFSLYMGANQLLYNDKESLDLTRDIYNYHLSAVGGSSFDCVDKILTITNAEGEIITYDDYLVLLGSDFVGWNDSDYGKQLVWFYFDFIKDNINALYQ